MKKKYSTCGLVISILILSSFFVNAQQIYNKETINLSEKDKAWFDRNPDSLPIWLTQEELTRLDEIGKDFEGTSAPPQPVRMPAEFEPMEGVLIRYPFGLSYQIIAEMAQDVEVVTIVASISEKNTVISLYQSNGVNLDNCDFLIAPSNSYWTRDYGPWFIFNGNNEQGIVDTIYNRPRPYDDAIPIAFGAWRSIPVYGLSLEHSGGNYMTDGHGNAVSTDIVWSENSGYTHQQINQMMQDYCGISTYYVVPDALGDYIAHIDCWAKFLSPDTIMIIKSSTSHTHYQDFEEAAQYFENQTSCYGTPYNVVRIYSHLSEPYINSLILNNKVFVPITGSQWDDEAIASYQDALPGYEVLGFTGSWVSTDALHCRAKGIVDGGMLYIDHTPLSGTQSNPEGYEITAFIYPYNEQAVNTAQVIYKINGGSWEYIDMESIGDSNYCAIIPAQNTGSVVDYYIHAEDDSGRVENNPYIGESMAYTFNCELLNYPPETPSINGPIKGKPGIEYKYTFVTNDPDEDNVFYYIYWGDGDIENWFGPYLSGEEVTANHSWSEEGTYTVKIKAKDIFDQESDFSEIDISIPRVKLVAGFLSHLSNILKLIRFLSN